MPGFTLAQSHKTSLWKQTKKKNDYTWYAFSKLILPCKQNRKNCNVSKNTFTMLTKHKSYTEAITATTKREAKTATAKEL